jgi:hypothetical protein
VPVDEKTRGYVKSLYREEDSFARLVDTPAPLG